eukprot:21151_1
MSSPKQQIYNLLDLFVEAQDEYNNHSNDNIQKVIDKFNKVEDAINALPSSYQEKLILIKAALDQWQGLIHADYALHLFESMQSYSNIRSEISESLNYFESSKDKIDDFEQTVNCLDWVIIDNNNGGILINFGNFRV